MCGRYTLTVFPQQLAQAFEIDELEPIQPRYNIAPTQLAAVVRVSSESGRRELAMHQWGLIPHWAKDPTIGNRMINARAETAAEKPAFRYALRRQRCLVPCTGFYEWKVLDPAAKKPAKQPYYIRRRDESVFAFAGLWDRWQSPEGEEIGSFTILTTEPNELMRHLHNRMPVIIPRQEYGVWLDPGAPGLLDAERLAPLLGPYPAGELVAHAVGKRVNNPKFDDPSCIQAV